MVGVHFRTVIRWIEQGHLAAYRLPGRGDNRVRTEDFLAFLNKHAIPLPAELEDRAGRILVVEDDAAVCKLITRLLEGSGYQVRVARNGFEAGAEAMAFRPALMTLDLGLPGMNGLEVLRFVRQRPELESMGVLVVSALPADVLDRALQEGADAALPKPFKTQVLLDQVRKLVRPSRDGSGRSRGS